jgi:hypothetical protein
MVPPWSRLDTLTLEAFGLLGDDAVLPQEKGVQQHLNLQTESGVCEALVGGRQSTLKNFIRL